MHGVVKSTVCRSVNAVLDVIIDHLFQEIVRFPEDCSNLAIDFLRLGGFPFVCGCVDGTLINIDAPRENESHFVDRYGNHSINTLMICGPDMNFFCVNPNWPGATHDARVLRNTIICKRFDEGWRPFPDAVILGDSGYGASDWLIPPVFNNPNNEAERRFNKHHKKTRRLIECAYGILKERFPCLNHLRLQPKKSREGHPRLRRTA
ncbi:unnamed protein product [Allacma fusca]|uniref:DDE Tnp4 domain-containing protein n=1 Tax=Allacma fusca TaxID=39272 RepID=A0A8J2LIY5_9HEXA|nr:unnamed protein product [Allacma fusca]